MINLETIDHLLRVNPLFSWLCTESIAWFAHQTDELIFTQGETIFEKGSMSDALYIIASGEVTFISGSSLNTDEQNASTLEENQFFGELSILEPKARSASVRAALPTTLYQIKAATFQKFAAKSQDQHAILTTNLARILARKIREFNAEISRQAKLNSNPSKP